MTNMGRGLVNVFGSGKTDGCFRVKSVGKNNCKCCEKLIIMMN